MQKLRRFLLGPWMLLILGVAGIAYGNYKFFRVIPQESCGDVKKENRKIVCPDLAEEMFRHGSLGAENERGMPYPIFYVLPTVFANLMPQNGVGGYSAFGLPKEEGRELHSGFSKRTLGFDRITQTCAICHTASYRMKPEDKPTLVSGGPSHTSNVQEFLRFLQKAANDPRFTADVLMPEIERQFTLGLDDKLIYRFILIPITKQRILEQADGFKWMEHEFRRGAKRPDWGPGRDDPMNLTKFFLLKADITKDQTTGNADFPAIWDLGSREGHSLNYAGETLDPLAVLVDSALGLGAPPGPQFIKQMKEIRAFLRNKAAPRYPLAPDEGAPDVLAGKEIYAQQCADCHSFSGRYFGKVIPIADIGTDRERYDTWQQEDADGANRVAKEMGAERRDMIKDNGYVSGPLSGVWLRAPYLHNGAVPNLKALLDPTMLRPKIFYRGCDLYDAENMGFVSQESDATCHNRFALDTSLPGNGNGGHTYGVWLGEPEKRQLIEYLKTL